MNKHKNKKIKIQGLDSLYISLTSPNEKRRNLLHSIKNSLIMQDELDVISQIRKDKRAILNEIKKLLSEINVNYQNLKKNLPDVKNVISFTEKELSELENEVKMLKHTIKDDTKIIDRVEDAEDSIRDGNLRHPNRKKKQIKEVEENRYVPNEKLGKPTTVKVSQKPETISKLDRIKNNLKVIEAKLEKL